VLLMADDTKAVTLSGGAAQPVSAAFLAYLTAQPVVVTLGELAQLSGAGAAAVAGATGDGAETLTDDQKQWLSKSLGVDPVKVQETINRDKKAMPAQKGAM
jgi:hypothetical protein